jgi:hypothetical protein
MEQILENKLLAELKKLQDQIAALKPEPAPKPSKAEALNDLFAALAKAQSEMQIASLDSENPYFKSKYADLASIVKASRPSLTKNGLSVIQQIMPNEDGQNILHTILCHSSGQWIESRMRILPTKPDVQSLISYVTYIRRASYASLIGVVTGDEDDDGEKAVAESREVFAKGVALNRKYDPKEESYESISKDQLDELEYELTDYPDIAEQILEGMKIQSISDLPKSKYSAAIRRVREIKQLRNGVK